jgi:hypothetical protein
MSFAYRRSEHEGVTENTVLHIFRDTWLPYEPRRWSVSGPSLSRTITAFTFNPPPEITRTSKLTFVHFVTSTVRTGYLACVSRGFLVGTSLGCMHNA